MAVSTLRTLSVGCPLRVGLPMSRVRSCRVPSMWSTSMRTLTRECREPDAVADPGRSD